MKNYNVIGLMSGTSLDGLDIALCSFEENNNKWNFKIKKAITIPYESEWKNKLINAHTLDALSFITLHKEYGTYTGNKVSDFIDSCSEKIDLIASHGHTIFHQPKKLTFQLGDGACIAAKTNTTTVSDFRTLDVALQGQGAPLVPIGDALLFNNYEFCLNLGGFANISHGTPRVAYDICPVNIVTNHLANKLGAEYDKNGEMAKQGSIHLDLLKELNSLSYFQLLPPKSLGLEWVKSEYLPVLNKYKISINDTLRTVYENIATQIAKAINHKDEKSVLITGGGTFNKFLIELLKEKTKTEIIIPDNKIIDYKEALIFALLGILRQRNEVNCLASVTGAVKDNMGGVIHQI